MSDIDSNWDKEVKLVKSILDKQEKESEINRMYRKLKHGIWTVAYENNSDEVYREVLGDLDELMKMIQK